MKKMMIIAMLGITLFSCKKNNPQPEVKIEKEYIHDTIHGYTDTVKTNHTDTVYVNNSALPLQGIWNCWKMETYNGGNLASTSLHSDWVFTFGTINVIQNLGTSGTYTYPVTYYNGSVDIYFTSGVATNYFTTPINNGQEYKLIKYPGSGSYQIWYLKK